VSTKLGSLPTSQMDVDKPSQISEDDMLMQMDMPVIDSKSSKSKPKTEDQENKPGYIKIYLHMKKNMSLANFNRLTIIYF
jgi:hypothetical protein